MAALGHDPLVAIEIALVGNPADTDEQAYGATATVAEQLPEIKAVKDSLYARVAEHLGTG